MGPGVLSLSGSVGLVSGAILHVLYDLFVRAIMWHVTPFWQHVRVLYYMYIMATIWHVIQIWHHIHVLYYICIRASIGHVIQICIKSEFCITSVLGQV